MAVVNVCDMVSVILVIVQINSSVVADFIGRRLRDLANGKIATENEFFIIIISSINRKIDRVA
jgi:hypothetical protein